MFVRRILFCAVCQLVAIGIAWPAMAQTFNENQALSFGTFVVKNNSSVHTLRVTRTGATTPDSAFIEIDPAVPGDWDLSGFPPSTQMSISIANVVITGSGGQTFSVGSFTPNTPLTTDALGNANLKFGATLSTSGSGIPYSDGGFSGSYDVVITY